MEVLFFILIVIFLSVSGKNSKKKKGQDAVQRPAAKGAVQRPSEALRRMAESNGDIAEALGGLMGGAAGQAQAARAKAKTAKAQARVSEDVKPVKVAGQQSPVFMAAKAPLGASILDEEGCVGGSMEHGHEEGESREEHRRHVEEAHRREARETLADQAAAELGRRNLSRLRQAVVMAEILDRPKALRRRAS